MIPLYDVDNTLLSTIAPYNFVPGQPPIHKIYNISLSDPLGNHSLINKIYEDVLPGDQTIYSFIKMNERASIKNFMRTSILDKYDGEELTLKGGNKSLLSWLKIFDANPYTLENNPYKDLPYDFLLYRSAYPIRYNKEEHVLKTTPTSMAFNLRIYRLTNAALDIFTTNNKIVNNTKDFHHVWRDIEYYRWVDTLIKRKISPNFLNIILYVQDNKSKVGFNELDIIIKKNKLPGSFDLQRKNIKNIYDTITSTPLPPPPVLPPILPPILPPLLPPLLPPFLLPPLPSILPPAPILPTIPIQNIDLTQDSDRILIAITEAPNTNIIKWNSMVYHSYGTVKTMVATGFHKKEVWNSILFQLIYAFAVMEKEKIYFNNFSLKNNVFIKDVQTDGTGNSCWVYKVDNIEYYIPNYGYILVIDSNYADITTMSPDKQYKIYMPDQISHNYDDDIYISTALKDQFKTILSDLSTSLTAHQANNLDTDVLVKINEIKTNLVTNDIIKILPLCFKEFTNNKIGKILTKLEKEGFNILSRSIYIPGSIMVRQKRFDDYDWVLYIGPRSPMTSTILYKNDTTNKLEFGTVNSSILYSYPINVLPEDKTIIETYTYFT